MTNSRIEIDGYASGMDERALRAAWTILVNACDGRLLEGPWIDRSGERLRYIYDADDSAAAVLSTSDRSVLLVVHSLMDDERTVALGEDLGLIEQEDLKVVLSALTWFLEEDVEPLLVRDEHGPFASASGPAAAPSASASGATGDADADADADQQTTDSEAGDR